MVTIMIKGKNHTCNSERSRCFHCLFLKKTCKIYEAGFNKEINLK